MKAIIQGELHFSKRDRNSLLSRITEDADLVFVEGRKDEISLSDLSAGMSFFLVGLLMYRVFLGSINSVRLPPKVEHIKNTGIDVDSEIDKEFPDIYSGISPWVRRSIMVIYAIVAPTLATHESPASFQMSLSSVSAAEWVLIVIFSPFVYFAVIILIESDFIRDRDETMARSIIEKSVDEGYGNVIISCGQTHVGGIREALEENGWDVETHNSRFAWLSIRYWKSKLT